LEAAEGMAGLASTGEVEASEAAAEAAVDSSDTETMDCYYFTRSIFSSSTVLAESVDVNSLIQMCD
jgi:hypothetical protein